MTPSDEQAATEHFIRGQKLAGAGHYFEAKAAYRQSIDRHPAFLPAIFALGQLHAIQRELEPARQYLSRAMALTAGNDNAAALVAPALATVLAGTTPQRFHPDLEKDALACLDDARVDAQTLSAFLAHLIRAKYPDSASDAAQIGNDPLWIAFLTRCINTDPAIETRLTALRRTLLDHYAGAKAIPHKEGRALFALAIQALANEYVWPVTPEEQASLDKGALPMLAALYRPFAEAAPERELRALKKDRLSGMLVKLGLSDVLTERSLAAAMPSMGGEASDAISQAVRGQYEEHPYPRWRAAPSPRAMPLRALVVEMPGVDVANLPDGDYAVLIAGCGTGYEAAGVALTDPAAKITAIDLSLASLAHASRMAGELGIGNLSFHRGNILDVAALGATFDLIYSTGVLHHMDQPKQGLAALANVLAPGGAIRIALYSHTARAAIRDAHALIREHGWASDADGIRAFRAYVLALPETDSLALLRASPDFYSISGCRDLIFHVHEHQVTLAEMAAMFTAAGIDPIGLEPPEDVMRLFAESFGPRTDPLDFERWEQLEKHDPTIFAGMYVLWGQKRG